MSDFGPSTHPFGQHDSTQPPNPADPNSTPSGNPTFYANPASDLSTGFPTQATISLPKPGGAISPTGEKLSFNASQGTASFTIPFPITAADVRGGVQPSVTFTYNSGLGNGVLGYGWDLGLGVVMRKTSNGVPRYGDADTDDVFIFNGAEDLVPELEYDAVLKEWVMPKPLKRIIDEVEYDVRGYRIRIEMVHQTIEHWVRKDDGTSYWRTKTGTNQTFLYGDSSNSRIADPLHVDHIFTWLLSSVTDDKGNRMIFTYKPEDSANVDTSAVYESNRSDLARTANRYLSSIKYGNAISTLSGKYRGDVAQHWFFELCFDYGEFDELNPTPADATSKAWVLRKDPFSNYRPGFEVRTYRLCRRVLMFHHFPEEGNVGINCLVKSMELQYRESGKGAFLEKVTLVHHMRSAARASNEPYITASMPPIEIRYTEVDTEKLQLKQVDPGSMEGISAPMDGNSMGFVDLYGDGIPGMLIQTPATSTGQVSWYYKPALGDGVYGPAQEVKYRPSNSQLGTHLGCHLADIDGDGLLEILNLSGPIPGFSHLKVPDSSSTSSLEADETWDSTTPFPFLPHLNYSQANTQLVDLTGNGFPDILHSTATASNLHFFPGLGPAGFSSEFTTPPYSDDSPLILGSPDITTLTYLADMTGAGLPCIVHLHRSGEISYHPSLGHGKFGRKITMSNPPHLSDWDPRRIVLIDTDGTGTADLVYLGATVTLFHNHSGNAWSNGIDIPAPMGYDPTGWVAPRVTDVLGLGTSAVVWVTELPGAGGGAGTGKMWYTDLSSGVKPNMLKSVVNNVGTETHIEYAATTRFAMRDKLKGRKWETRLPFPVAVVERVVVRDRVKRTRRCERWRYRNGWFDGSKGEREVRGFGMVERWDAEVVESAGRDADGLGDIDHDRTSYVPPVVTKMWFHLGLYPSPRCVVLLLPMRTNRLPGHGSHDFQHEYYSGHSLLPETPLPTSTSIMPEHGPPTPHPLSSTDNHNLHRSLKSHLLREEIYALDGTPRQSHPYSIAEYALTTDLLQPSHPELELPAVFRPRVQQTVTVMLERAASFEDARLTQKVVLEVDAFGNILREMAVAYGRRGEPAQEEGLEAGDVGKQKLTYAVYNEFAFTGVIRDDNALRTPVKWDAQSWQIFNLPPVRNGDGALFYTIPEIREMVHAAFGREGLPFGDYLGATKPRTEIQRRLITHARMGFYDDALEGPIPWGVVAAHGIPYRLYQKTLPRSLVERVFTTTGRIGDEEVDGVMREEGGYVEIDGDGNGIWWSCSGVNFYSPDDSDSDTDSASTIAFAREHFFLPHRYRSPFHSEAVTTEYANTYDAYCLLLLSTTDPMGNRTSAGERSLDIPGEPLILGQRALDYRVLAPTRVMDANGNVGIAVYDVMGLCTATISRGRPGENIGDDEDGVGILDDAAVRGFFDNPAKEGVAEKVLGTATTRTITDVTAYYRWARSNDPEKGMVTPVAAAVVVRETHHHSDSKLMREGERPRTEVQVVVKYLDGEGRDVQSTRFVGNFDSSSRSATREEEEEEEEEEEGKEKKWLTSGWSVYNNKLLPIRTYDPVFAATHRFTPARLEGVSMIPFYDPLGRVVATLFPDHTWQKTVFGPWRTEHWTAAATVEIDDPRSDAHVGEHFRRLADEGLFWPTWKARRLTGELGEAEKRAAQKAAIHADATTVTHVDTTGAVIVTLAMNNLDRGDGTGVEKLRLARRQESDIAGNVRVVGDAMGRAVVRREVDMLGRIIEEVGMELGRTVVLRDIDGKAVRTWNERKELMQVRFDAVRRVVAVVVKMGGENGQGKMVQRMEYGDDDDGMRLGMRNARGRVVRSYDQAGVVDIAGYDFCGNAIEEKRRFAREYREVVDWARVDAVPVLERGYTTTKRFDALNRCVEATMPDGSLVETRYDKRDFVVSLSSRSSQGERRYVTDTRYNAMGQKESVTFSNGTKTTHTYDPTTHLLRSTITRRDRTRFPDDCPSPPLASWPGCQIQSLHYTYDPVGRISEIRDDAQQRIFFANRRVEPAQEFVYDSLGQLVKATGREHVSAVYDPWENAQRGLAHPNDGLKMRGYTQRFWYDAAGNMWKLQHDAGEEGSWTKRFEYETERNRLSRVTKGSGVGEAVEYDVMGNAVSLPHLERLEWDYRNRLKVTMQQRVGFGTPERTWYCYDAQGRRVRKVTENYARPGETPTLKEERIYLGSYERYHRFAPGVTVLNDDLPVSFHRDTLRLESVVVVEKESGQQNPFTRFHLTNHVSSSTTELDDTGEVITHEEYTPYGNTTFQSTRSTSLPAKRYRYLNRERDDETGFYYCGYRYYTPWLGRWLSPDPAGIVDGLNLYTYARNNPVSFSDPTGLDSKSVTANNWVPVAAPPIPWTKGDAEGKGATPKEVIARDVYYLSGHVVGGDMRWEKTGERDEGGKEVVAPLFTWIREKDVAAGDPEAYPGFGVLTRTPGEVKGGEAVEAGPPRPVEGPESLADAVSSTDPGISSSSSSSSSSSPTDEILYTPSDVSPSSSSASSGPSSPSPTDHGSLIFDRGLDITFWSTLLLLGSTTALSVSTATIFTLLAATLGLAAGLAGILIGLTIFALSFSHSASQNREASNAAGTALSLAGHPMSLAGGVVGVMVDGERGLAVGSAVGRVTAGRVDGKDAREVVGRVLAGERGGRVAREVAGVAGNVKSYSWDLWMAVKAPVGAWWEGFSGNPAMVLRTGEVGYKLRGLAAIMPAASLQKHLTASLTAPFSRRYTTIESYLLYFPNSTRTRTNALPPASKTLQDALNTLSIPSHPFPLSHLGVLDINALLRNLTTILSRDPTHNHLIILHYAGDSFLAREDGPDNMPLELHLGLRTPHKPLLKLRWCIDDFLLSQSLDNIDVLVVLDCRYSAWWTPKHHLHARRTKRTTVILAPGIEDDSDDEIQRRRVAETPSFTVRVAAEMVLLAETYGFVPVEEMVYNLARGVRVGGRNGVPAVTLPATPAQRRVVLGRRGRGLVIPFPGLPALLERFPGRSPGGVVRFVVVDLPERLDVEEEGNRRFCAWVVGQRWRWRCEMVFAFRVSRTEIKVAFACPDWVAAEMERRWDAIVLQDVAELGRFREDWKMLLGRRFKSTQFSVLTGGLEWDAIWGKEEWWG
ncbi:hypothetical protein EX30DRAFT_366172 [Ascodesmis nigricans]|uniref:SpvB-domain-containing protein n=1 Tax=Ascodesmis nigricans TaxID=341454 RepID=A0A4V3SHY6_9PEZI|nr:hypothetical protein EX30DRAFT_366172 [Ascodesmis nigricans]